MYLYLALTQLISCSFMCGLIWLVQIVHYPSFLFVDQIKFKKFNSFHQSKITYIVLPVMLIELASSVLVSYFSINILNSINLLLLIGVWLSTFLLSVPIHSKLLVGFNEAKIMSLVRTNWLRTLFFGLLGFY